MIDDRNHVARMATFATLAVGALPIRVRCTVTNIKTGEVLRDGFYEPREGNDGRTAWYPAAPREAVN